MSAKTSAEVVIDGKVYTLSGYEGEEYLQKVASYINGKINEFTSIEEYRHIPLNMKNTLIQLNIADDYFKAKDQVEKLERDLENKEKEIYDLKHDLISNQVKTETAEESLKKLERDNKELLLNKARLEAALEDKLLQLCGVGFLIRLLEFIYHLKKSFCDIFLLDVLMTLIDTIQRSKVHYRFQRSTAYLGHSLDDI